MNTHGNGHRLADRLAESLSEKVKTMEPGEKLPSENILAAEFKVSRAVVREAVAQLRSIGTLTTRQGSGIYVALPSPTNLRLKELDHYNPLEIIKFAEIRSGLDAAAARFAALRRTKAQLDAMRLLCERARQKSADVEEAAQSDTAFHLAIVEATGNEHFISVQKFLSEHLRQGVAYIRRVEAISPQMQEEVDREHAAILEAIAAKEPERAARAAEQHVLNGQKRLKYSLNHFAKSL